MPAYNFNSSGIKNLPSLSILVVIISEKTSLCLIGVVDPYKIAQDEFKSEYSIKNSYSSIDDLFND